MSSDQSGKNALTFDETDATSVLFLNHIQDVVLSSSTSDLLSHNPSENDLDVSSTVFNSLDVKYRAVDVASSHFPISVENYEPLPLQKLNLDTKIESVGEGLEIPERPIILCKTNFIIPMPTTVKDAVDQVNSALRKSTKVRFDYKFFDANLMWKGRHIQGSTSCNVHVHLYKDWRKSNEVIVELNRVKGDAKPFFELFKELKSSMTSLVDRAGPLNVFSFGSLPTIPISDEQFLRGIEVIFVMAKSGLIESEDESSKMLFDLSNHEPREQLELEMCGNKVIECIEKLLIDEKRLDVEDSFQHSIMALFSFCESSKFYKTLCANNSNIMEVVLRYAHDSEGDYETLEIRRECLRIVDTLTKEEELVEVITRRNAEAVEEWLSKPPSGEIFCRKIGDNIRKRLIKFNGKSNNY